MIHNHITETQHMYAETGSMTSHQPNTKG